MATYKGAAPFSTAGQAVILAGELIGQLIVFVRRVRYLDRAFSMQVLPMLLLGFDQTPCRDA